MAPPEDGMHSPSDDGPTSQPAGRRPRREAAAPSRDAADRTSRQAVGAVVMALAVLLAGVVAWGIDGRNEVRRLNDDLSRAGAELQATQQENSRLIAENETLVEQVQAQDACLKVLLSIQEELVAAYEKMRDNFNATAEGSKYAKAFVTDRESLRDAIDYYYRAYSAAFVGRLTTANSYIAKGNAEIKKSDAALETLIAEAAKVDKVTDELGATVSQLGDRMSDAAVTCRASP